MWLLTFVGMVLSFKTLFSPSSVFPLTQRIMAILVGLLPAAVTILSFIFPDWPI